MRHILAATDFSPGAQQAVNRAARLAAELGCGLTLLHVFNERPWQAIYLSLQRELQAEAAQVARAQAELTQLAHRVQETHGVRAATHLLKGAASREIAAFAARHIPEAIVVGAQRQEGAAGMVGGTALKVLKGQDCPVLLVRQPAGEPYHEVLVACDFSDACVRALRRSAQLFPAAARHLIHVYDNAFEDMLRLDGASPDEAQRFRRAAQKTAHRQLDELGAECGLPNLAREVLPGVPAQVLIDRARDFDAPVLVVGRHGGATLEERLFGSVTQNVLYHAGCDVLVVP